MICGAEGWEDIEDYGHSQAAWFTGLLELPHGIPRHDTFRRVLSQLDSEDLTRCFISWTDALRGASGGESVSADGKTLRHSFDRATEKVAMHMVSAGATANRLVLGQCKVDDKAKEITAIPTLLKMLELSDAAVTIDAMGCQEEIATVITDQQADDVLALKGNHKTLYDDVTLFLNDAKATEFAQIAHSRSQTVDGDHGRIETCTYWLPSAMEW